MTGIVFSDLGRASSFMSLEWVQSLLSRHLGYRPFPATLNLRPHGSQDAELWRRMKSAREGIPLTEATAGHCGARLFRVEIHGPSERGTGVSGAVLLPEVTDYPNDKIEVVAPVRLKEHFGIADGDTVILEFLT